MVAPVLVTVLPLAAAANAALLALALWRRAWVKRARAGLYAAAVLLGAAAAISLIALDHAGAPWDPRVVAFLEGLLTLSAGPLLLLFVLNLFGFAARPWLFFAPAAFFMLGSALFSDWVAHAFVVERLVLVQMAFTIAAGAATAWRKPTGRRAANARALAFAAVATMGVLHLAQIARMLWPRAEAITDIVPLVGAGAFLAATAAVYLGGRISALDPLVDIRPAPDADMRALAAMFDEASAGMLRNPNLSLTQAAAAIGASPERLSMAIAAVHEMSFTEYLQGLRVAAAKALLSDPNEARTSMEAIGLLAGFGSRSAFYKIFGERVGMSPAVYRAQCAQNGVQIPESGQ
jgi:AraC-like DNA-binding protein